MAGRDIKNNFCAIAGRGYNLLRGAGGGWGMPLEQPKAGPKPEIDPQRPPQATENCRKCGALAAGQLTSTV